MLEVQRLEGNHPPVDPGSSQHCDALSNLRDSRLALLGLEYCPGQDLYYWLEQAQDAGQPTFEEQEPADKTLIGQGQAAEKPNGAAAGFTDDKL